MALKHRRETREDIPFVSNKQRDLLLQRKAEYLALVNQHLEQLEDSPFKVELVTLRDRFFAKFPAFPVDLSSWVVAYYEDWLREFEKVPVVYHLGQHRK